MGNSRLTISVIRPPILNPFTDEEILFACNDRDILAQAEIFRRFRQPVSHYLSQLMPGADVEDLVQSVFLEVVRGKFVFEGRSSAKAWLFGVARNVWRQHCRTMSLRSRMSRQFAVLTPTYQDERVAVQLDARRAARSLASRFASLPENSQRAFCLCCIEGASARKAGRILNASEAAIWKRLSVTRKALQQAVSE